MAGALRSLVRRTGFDVVRAPAARFPFKHLTDQLGINFVLDVGANEGQYASLLRATGYPGHIFSFEPASSPLGKLVANSENDPHWFCENCAIGSKSGRLRLNLSSNSLLSSIRPVDHNFARENAWATLDAGYEEVEVKTIDDILGSFQHDGARMLLKIDVQGFEDEVLKGAKNSFSQISAIQVEMPIRCTYVGQSDIHQLTGQLKAEGFDLSHLCTGSQDMKGRLIEVDGFFIRRDLL